MPIGGGPVLRMEHGDRRGAAAADPVGRAGRVGRATGQPNLPRWPSIIASSLYDHRGTGRSDRALPDDRHRRRHGATTSLALMDALGHRARRHRSAMRSGGIIGLALARIAPERLEQAGRRSTAGRRPTRISLRCFDARLHVLRDRAARRAYRRARSRSSCFRPTGSREHGEQLDARGRHQSRTFQARGDARAAHRRDRRVRCDADGSASSPRRRSRSPRATTCSCPAPRRERLAAANDNVHAIADGVGRPRLQRHRSRHLQPHRPRFPQELSPCKSASSCPSTTTAG